MMRQAVQTLCTAFLTGGGCSIILYMLQHHDMAQDKRADKIDKIADAVRGIEHTEIIDKGTQYIDRGYITPAEFSEIDANLYRPYKALIVTILLTIVFAILLLKGGSIPEQFLTIYTVVIGFYFGTQAEKNNSTETK